MTRLKALWILLLLPRASIDEAYDALLSMREFWREPLDIAGIMAIDEIAVELGDPVVRPEFSIDYDEIAGQSDSHAR